MDDAAVVEGSNPNLGDEVAALRREVAALRRELEQRTPSDHGDPDVNGAPIGRRRLLVGGAGAAVAAVAGVVGHAAPAAANGGSVVMGTLNDAGFDQKTTLRAYNGGFSLPTLVVDNQGGTIDGGLALEVVAPTGIGLRSVEQYNLGWPAVLVGGRAQLKLLTSGVRNAPTDDVFEHEAGSLVRDSSGILWCCVASGQPGTWRRLTGPTSAGAFHVLPAPVRVYDSRPGTSPATGPKTKLPAGNVARTIDLAGNASGVPAGAVAVAVNLLVVNAAAGSANLTVWAAGTARPSANTMVWGGTSGRASTFAVTAVDPTVHCQVSASVATDIAVDVVGYYR